MKRKPDTADQQRWKIAKKRVAFKKNLTSYVVVNIVLILIWLSQQGFRPDFDTHFWPGYVIFFWGISLIFAFRGAYGSQGDTTMEEYERLREEEQGSGSAG